MRLLKLNDDGGLSSKVFFGNDIPQYAILSHTWGEDDEEVTAQDLVEGTGEEKAGYYKLIFCGKQALQDGLQYFWVDTCCIDKASSAELQEAINSMFEWYQKAQQCYVYLSDIAHRTTNDKDSSGEWKSAFKGSRWFTRGWTLQELVAPASVVFFCRNGEKLGTRESLLQEIHDATSIPIKVFKGHHLSQFSVKERMSWAERRQTKRPEDKIYSLLGIFDIHMPLIYGEGVKKAHARLLKLIKESSENETSSLSPTVSARSQDSTSRPSSNIPYLRNPEFVDSGEILDQIRKKCAVPASRIALVGVGGIGKSQFAIEYCYRNSLSPDAWVFWVCAGNTTRLKQGFQAIADQVQLAGVIASPSSNNQETRIGGDGGALQQGLLKYLPRCPHGSVLMTSRTKHAALQLVEESDIISIEPMTIAASNMLLQKMLSDEFEMDSIAKLARALEYMPLALVQAAAYIRNQAPRCSAQRYLEHYAKIAKQKTSSLNWKAENYRDAKIKNSIIVTWQILIDHLQSKKRSAADLLSLMSFFDRQGIQKSLLRGHESLLDRYKNGDKPSFNELSTGSDARINSGIEDDILTLRNYSLITVTTEANVFEVHEPVQVAMQNWLAAQQQLDLWRELFITNLCLALPTGEYKNSDKCQVLFPHARAALGHRSKSRASLVEWSLLLYNAAWYAWRRGWVDEAYIMSVMSMKVRLELFGVEKEETLSSMALVGLACKLRGRWMDAERLEVQVLQTRKKLFGEKDVGTLNSMNNLAFTYLNLRRWTEAEELDMRAMKARKELFGEEDLGTLGNIAGLALMYRNQGRWVEAEELETQVMETRKSLLGEEHTSTLTSITNLAVIYRNRGRLKEAEDSNMRVMENFKKELGKEHTSTLAVMNDLALTYRSQGRWKEAEQLLQQVLETLRRILGADHPSTLTCINNLALAYRGQGQPDKAEKLFEQSIEMSKMVDGEKNLGTIASMNNLAFTLKDQGRTVDAILQMEKCLPAAKRVLGAQHPKVLSSFEALNIWRRESIET